MAPQREQESKALTDADLERMSQEGSKPSKGVGLTDAQLDQMEGNPNFANPSNTSAADPSVMRQFLGGVKDVGIGAGKQLFNIGDAPWRLFTGNKPMDWTKPEGLAQKGGSQAMEALSYLAPVGAEAKAAGWVEKGLANAPRLLRVAGNAVARGAIGAGSAKATSFANAEESPSLGWAAGIPAAFSLLSPALAKGSEYVRDSARNSLARAIEPGSIVDKMHARKILDPLLKAGYTWFTNRGMKNVAQDIINEASAAKTQARESMGERPLVSYDEFEPKLREASDKEFRSGKTAMGIPMSNIPSEAASAEAMDDFVNKYILPKVETDPTGARFIPFDELDVSKRSAQRYASQHGNAFLDMPRDPVTSTQADVTRVVSNTARPTLEDFAPEAWSDANKRLSLGLTMRELADQRAGKKLGQKVPLAEREIGGFGWKMGAPSTKSELPGMLTRGYRRLANSPGWNTSMANLKWKIANGLTQYGFAPAQIEAYLQSKFGPEDNNELQRGTTVQNPLARQHSNTVTLQAPDGKVKQVPADQADHYIKLGAKPLVQ